MMRKRNTQVLNRQIRAPDRYGESNSSDLFGKQVQLFSDHNALGPVSNKMNKQYSARLT